MEKYIYRQEIIVFGEILNAFGWNDKKKKSNVVLLYTDTEENAVASSSRSSMNVEHFENLVGLRYTRDEFTAQ